MEPVELTINLIEAVEDLQLGLTKEQVELIAKDIKRGWDFSHIYEEIEVKVEESARYANITLSTWFKMSQLSENTINKLADTLVSDVID